MTWTRCQRFCRISTHTLTWSVTILMQVCRIARQISTHTLTWSVTEIIGAIIDGFKDFNSHAHVERDYPLGAKATDSEKFQLTRSRGA